MLNLTKIGAIALINRNGFLEFEKLYHISMKKLLWKRRKVKQRSNSFCVYRIVIFTFHLGHLAVLTYLLI